MIVDEGFKTWMNVDDNLNKVDEMEYALLINIIIILITNKLMDYIIYIIYNKIE